MKSRDRVRGRIASSRALKRQLLGDLRRLRCGCGLQAASRVCRGRLEGDLGRNRYSSPHGPRLNRGRRHFHRQRQYFFAVHGLGTYPRNRCTFSHRGDGRLSDDRFDRRFRNGISLHLGSLGRRYCLAS